MQTHSVTDIIAGTPIWVWGVLIALLWAGWRQREDRILAGKRAMLLSAVLFFWSASSVVMGTVFPLLTSGVWLAGVLIAFGLTRRIDLYLPQATAVIGQVYVRGSYLPLIAFMVLFTLHYLQGVSHAGVLHIHQTIWFATVFAGIGGLISGTFLARLIELVRIASRRG